MESRGMSQQTISTKDLPERKVFYLSCKGAWRQLPEMFAKLSDYSSMNGIKSIGPPSGFSYNTPQGVAVNDLIWEVCYPVGLDAEEHFDEESKTGVKRIPATRVAAIIHEGSYRKTSASYEKLQSWINTNSLDVCGPAEEVYLTDINKADGEQRIEIRLPVCIADVSG
jgi:AraC family transcriptional regulator